MNIKKVDVNFGYNYNVKQFSNEGNDVMEQINQSIIEEFMQEFENSYTAHTGFYKERVKDVSYSQVYTDPTRDKATILVGFTMGNDKFEQEMYVLLNATDCVINPEVDEIFTNLITKIWRNVLLNHFREQVTPYLKAEKAKKQQEINGLQKELENEFTFDDGVKI